MVTAWIEQKRRYRQYKARTEQLPASDHEAIAALERYLEFFGPTQADSLLSMLEDLADRFEQNAAKRTSVRAVVGENPVEFTDALLRNYPDGRWIARERERLTKAIDHVAAHEPRSKREPMST